MGWHRAQNGRIAELMRHRNYHEIDGESPAACGRALGRLFGPIVNDYLGDCREDDVWSDQRHSAEPLLAQTTKYFPEYAKELQAYADAAGVPLLDLWTMSIQDELDEDVAEKCTTIITNAGRLIAHNEDWDPDATEDICILKKRCAGVTTLELYYYGCPLGGTALSVCSNGYVQAINSISHIDHRIGVPKIVLARRMAEIRSIDTELDAILNVPRSSGFAHNLVDRDGRVTMVECTARQHRVSRPRSPSVHTNHILHADLAEFAGDHDGKSTFRRYETACDQVRPVMTTADAIGILSDETGGKKLSVFNQNTIARAVVDLDQRVASFWLRREKAKGWIDYPIDFFCDAADLVA